jgi:hypothetical protein
MAERSREEEGQVKREGFDLDSVSWGPISMKEDKSWRPISVKEDKRKKR